MSERRLGGRLDFGRDDARPRAGSAIASDHTSMGRAPERRTAGAIDTGRDG